jgi:hypothetical protein
MAFVGANQLEHVLQDAKNDHEQIGYGQIGQEKVGSRPHGAMGANDHNCEGIACKMTTVFHTIHTLHNEWDIWSQKRKFTLKNKVKETDQSGRSKRLQCRQK